MKTDNLKVYKPNDIKTDIILDANENPKDITKQLMDLIEKELKTVEFNRYPDTDALELRKAYGKYAGVNYKNIICGNGSDEIIRLILEAYVDKDEKILVHNPTFSMYDITNTIVGGKTIKVESIEVSIEQMISAADKNSPKVIFVCNPNNPTGYTFEKDDIINLIENTKALVVVDEAYIEFGGQSVIDLINTYERLIVLRTMSKAFGLAGIRCGFGISSEGVIETLNKVKPPYNLNTLTQKIATIALNNSELMKKQAQAIVKERSYLMSELQKLPYLKIYPSKANFIYAKTKIKNLREQIENKVSIRYFKDDYIRITVGTMDENQKLISILKQVEV